jgi:DNA adenine methylase
MARASRSINRANVAWSLEMNKIQTLLPVFGNNRTNAARPQEFLQGCEWIGVPFAGGMPEIRHFTARTIHVSDAHCFIINLARCVQRNRDAMEGLLYSMLFHPLTLSDAQTRCAESQESLERMARKGTLSLGLAIDYFVCCWMGRSAEAATDREFTGKLPVRWNSGGGDSNTRFRSAIAMLEQFEHTAQRCTFSLADGFVFLSQCKDAAKHGLYVDAPWPDDGRVYRHKFSDVAQISLERVLRDFRQTRVVVRFGDHPLIRDVYQEKDGWTFQSMEGRTQANSRKHELLITRNCS